MRAVMLLSAFLTFFSYAADVQLPRNDGVGLESLIETKIDRKEFEFEINKKTWKANNPIQRLSAQFDAGQLIVHSNNESNPTYLGLRVTGIGRDGAIQPVGSSRIRKRGERIEFDRQIGVTEWWKNGAKGLEQGFDIESQLSGEGILRIEMEIDSAEVVARGNDIIFKLSCGRELVFGKLKTLDANKNEVASSFETCGKNTFAILVNDINAQYPIQVDPTLSDAHWASGFGLRGVNGDVNAIALGTNGSVYVGGKFSIAGETAALNVAKWDGTSWSALGSGLSNTVRALAFYNNNLYAAGDFTSAGGIPANRIAKWDGTAWSALGAGVNDVVQALTIDASGAVYAGGSFTTAGGGSANRIAKWNGTAWSALGTGTSSTVYALLIDGSDILAGGAFGTAGGVSASRIARWNGTSWSSLGSGPDSLSTVYSIAKDSSNNIYVTAGNITSVQIRKWNGTAWSNLGSVLGFSLSGTACLDISNGDSIYLGGVTGLFIWTGTAWTRRNTGAIRAIKRDQNGNIYAGGQFYSNNSIVAANIAKWDATTCYALGQGNGASSDVNVLKYDSNGNLYVAGNFSTIGGIRANGIAKWDGVTWSSLGSGVSRTGGFEVRALEIDSNGHIYIGGLFSSAGGVSVGNIAKWDGTSWSTLSTGVNNSVYALSIDNSGNVYAGGNFTTAGGVTINRISKWNGTAWSALSTGMSSGIVYALTIDNSGSLYAGGTFTSAGGVSANRIAKWNGTAWAGVGSGASSTVFSLLKGNDGLIYAGGAFTTIGSVSANGIAAWNGTSWLNLGTGLGATVSEIVESNGVIYASSHSSTPTTKISIWDGVQWQTPYSGISGQILALAKTNNQPLYVGGSFSITGDKASSNFAKWINNEPVSNPPANTPASYSIGHTLVASTGDWSDPDNDSLTFTYRWIRADNDVGLNAAFISGATAPQYILTPNDAGRFVAVEVTANDGAGGISSRVSGYSYVRPVVTFSPNTLSVAENAGSANLTVTLSHSAGVETRVSYNVVGGNASGGVDYSLDSGVLVFAQGEISKNIPVALFNDAIDEFDETVEIILSNEENVDLVDLGEQKDHTLTILDDDLEPTVGLAALGEDSVGEADGIGSFWVFLSAPSEKPITVNYTFLADPNDITATDGTFTFEPQQVLGFIQFAITDDILDEGEESVGLTISNPVNAVLGTEPPLIDSASKFIIDDDRVFSFSVETSQIAENQAEAFVTIRVSTPMAGLFHLSVNLSVSGTALSPGDYAIQEENLGEMLFLQGEIEKVIPISINNDVLDEPNETIVFTLSNPRSGKLGLIEQHTLTIEDEDNAPSVAFSTATSEGSEATTSVNLLVALSAPSGRTISVPYAVTGGDATVGTEADFTHATSPLTFLPGETSKNITLTVNNDILDENDEKVEITLSNNPDNAVVAGIAEHTYSILDNDDTPTVAFTAETSQGSEGTAAVNLTVALSAPSGRTVTVNYAVTGGDATVGTEADFTLTASPLTFLPGETNKSITLTVNNDMLDENDESVKISLSNNPVNAVLAGIAEHTYSILDNDDTPTVAFTAETSQGSEGTAAVNLNVALSAPSGRTVTVDYGVTGGDATIGTEADFTLAAGPLTFAPGETGKNITLTVNNDAIEEIDETVEVTLASSVNAVIGTNIIHTYTILDNDNAPPTILVEASANPNPVLSTNTSLIVEGNDAAGEASLTYTWFVSAKDPGDLPDVSFNPNGSNTAKLSTATFEKAGSYTITARVQDESGLFRDSSVVVAVSATPKTIVVTPQNVILNLNKSREFSAAVSDQFGNPIINPENLTWSVPVLAGNILNTGVLTTGNIPIESFNVTASIGDLRGEAQASIVNASPEILSVSSAPQPVSEGVAELKAIATDDGPANDLTYTWVSSGIIPAPVQFSNANGTNDGKTTFATFIKAGDYDFELTVTDAWGTFDRKSVSVKVLQTPTNLVVTPENAEVFPNETIQFSVEGFDQFGNKLTSTPSVQWSLNGPGSLLPNGQYTAPPVANGSATITATLNQLTDFGTLTFVQNTPPSIVTPASAGPLLADGKTVALTVLGADATGGEPGLKYTWVVESGPSPAPQFTANGTNGAKSTTVTFSKSGEYTFKVIVADAGNLSEESEEVIVSVDAKPTRVTLVPTNVSLKIGEVEFFTATVKDQFDHDMEPAVPQTDFAWQLTGLGDLTQSGEYTAPTTDNATATVRATHTASSKSATAEVSVFANTPPEVSIAASAVANPVTETSVTVSVLGRDDGGEANLTYTWACENVMFATNGTNAAKNSTATFNAPGIYDVTVTLRDAGGKTAISKLTINVLQVPKTLSIAPLTAQVIAGNTTNFSATVTDQFNVNIVNAPVDWRVNRGGQIIANTANLLQAQFIAGAQADNAIEAVASLGDLTATAPITVLNAVPQITQHAIVVATNPDGKTVNLSVQANDDGGAQNLIYCWSAKDTSPAAVSFSPNNTNTAQNSTATFFKVGTYELQVLAQDTGGLFRVSTVQVEIAPRYSAQTMTVTPATTNHLNINTQLQFAVTVKDQFGQDAQEVAWTATGGGSINAVSGLYTAPAASVASPITITATVGAGIGLAQKSATITRINGAPSVSITSPAPDALLFGEVAAPHNLSLTPVVNRTDDVGTPGVQYILDGTLIIGSNFSVAPGRHTLSAVATDAQGLSSAVTPPVEFSVNTPPVIRLSQPENNSMYGALASISLIAEVVDPDNNVNSVVFETERTDVSSTAITHSAVNGPGNSWTFNFSPQNAGTYTVRAGVRDRATGNHTFTPTVSITLTDYVITAHGGNPSDFNDVGEIAGGWPGGGVGVWRRGKPVFPSNTLGGTLNSAAAINSNGVICGNISSRGYRWDSRTDTMLELQSTGTFSAPHATGPDPITVNFHSVTATDINDNNEVIGTLHFSAGTAAYFSAYWNGATISPVNPIYPRWTTGIAINNSGTIVGHQRPNTTANNNIIAWTPGGGGHSISQIIGNGTSDIATDINNNGAIVGSDLVEGSPSVFRATKWINGNAFHLSGGSAISINDDGDVLTGGLVHFADGSVIDLGQRGANTSSAIRINNRGQILTRFSIMTPRHLAPSVKIKSLSTTGNSITVVPEIDSPAFGVARVLYFDGTTEVGERTSAPFDFTFTNRSSGAHSIRVQVFNNIGADANATERIVVNPVPSIGTASWNSELSRLSVTAVDDDPLSFTWALIEGPGTVTLGNAATISVSFPRAGTYLFRATVTDSAGQTATSNVVEVVIAHRLSSVVIAPNAAPSLSVGDSFQFTAVALDPSGSPLNPQPTIVWSALSGGTIASNGQFSAGNTPSGYSIKASATLGENTAEAMLTGTINGLTAKSFRISPITATVQSGGSQQFSATVVDSSGNALSPQPAITWTASGGVISTGGLFTASGLTNGTHLITARLNASVEGHATVTISGETPSQTPLLDRVPTVTIFEPKPNQLFKTKAVTIKGTVSNDDGSQNVTLQVLVDNVPKANVKAPAGGAFSISVTVPDGKQDIIVVASEVNDSPSGGTLSSSSQTVPIWVDTQTPNNYSILDPDDFSSHASTNQAWTTAGPTIPNAFTSNAWFSGNLSDPGTEPTGVARVQFELPGKGYVHGGGSPAWTAATSSLFATGVVSNIESNLAKTAKTLSFTGFDEADNRLTMNSYQVAWTPLILVPGFNGNIAIEKGDAILAAMTPRGETWKYAGTNHGALLSNGYSICSAPSGNLSTQLPFVNGQRYSALSLSYASTAKDMLLAFDLFTANGSAVERNGGNAADAYAHVTVFELISSLSAQTLQVDNDDEDADGILNMNETGTMTSNNPNLVKLVIRRPNDGSGVPISDGNVSVAIYAPNESKGFGNARLYYHAGSTGLPPVGAMLTPSSGGKTFNMNEIDPVNGKTVFLQGLSASALSGDVTVVVSFDPTSMAKEWEWSKTLRQVYPLNIVKGSSDIIVDANHDGVIDAVDAAYDRAVFAAGFGLPNHPGLFANKIRLNLNVSYLSGTFKLASNSPRAKFYQGSNDVTNRTWPALSVPQTIDLELPADEQVEVRLERVRQTGEPPRAQKLTVAKLSNGLGEPDGISPQTEVIPGYASINVMSGNVHFSAAVRTYHTPAMGPSISIAYNHQDAVDTGLGLGWRTNYDMQIFDGSADRDLNGTVDASERVDGDVLVCVNESGRRSVFTYSTEDALFHSVSSTGLVNATLDPSGTDPASQYRLVRRDNLFYFFNKKGLLTRITNLQNHELTVNRDSNGHATSVKETSSIVLAQMRREEQLSRSSFEGLLGGTGMLSGLSGRELANWLFEYSSDTVPSRIKKIRVEGAFAHDAEVGYEIGYVNNVNKANTVQLPPVPMLVGAPILYAKTITYTPATAEPSVSANITEPFGGSTVFSTIKSNIDAWTTITNAGGVTTNRTVSPQTRQVLMDQRGVYKRQFGYDSQGNTVSDSVIGGVTHLYSFSNFGIPDANLLKSSALVGAGATVFDYYTTPASQCGLVKTVTDPRSKNSSYLYNGNGYLSEMIDERQQHWVVPSGNGLNAFGQVLRTVSPELRVKENIYGSTGLIDTQIDHFMNYQTSYTYDAMNRLTRTLRPGGTSTTTEYDPLGRVVRSKDIHGLQIEYVNDVLGRPTLIRTSGIADTNIEYTKLAKGTRVTSYRTDGEGGTRILAIADTDGLGRTVSSLKPVQLNASQVSTRPVTFAYTPGEGWLDTVTDGRPIPGVTRYLYDTAGRRTTVIQPEGGIERTAYHPAGWVSSTTDADLHTVRYEHDNNGNVTRVTNPAGGFFMMGYDDSGNITTKAPSSGNGETIGYDFDGLLKEQTDFFGKTTTTTYDGPQRTLTARTNNNNNRQIILALDERGFVVQSETVLGKNTYVKRNDGTTVQSKAPLRGISGSAVDGLGRLTAQYYPGGSTSIGYNSVTGDINRFTSLLGLVTTPHYHAATGEIASIEDNQSATGAVINTIVARDENGNVLQYRDASNLTWNQTFDRENRLETVTSPDGSVTTRRYTLGGNLERIIQNGATTTFTYNSLDQLETQTDPDGVVTTTLHDEFGRPTVSNVSGTQTSERIYDPNTKQLTEVRLSLGRRMRMLRDDFGRVHTMIDFNNEKHRYEYDDFDRVTRKIYPDGFDEKYEYNPVGGELAFVTDRAGRRAQLLRDLAGRVTLQKFIDTGETVAVSYNAAGQQTSSTFQGDAVSWGFDLRGRLSSVNHGGNAFTRTYNNDNRLDTETFLTSRKKYIYDVGTNRVERVEFYENDVLDDIVNYTYFTNGVHTGRVQSEAISNVIRSYNYTNAGRLSTYNQTIGAAAENYSFQRDGSGRVTRQTGPDWEVTFGFDGGDRLETETRTGNGAYAFAYTYDSNNNRLTQTGSINRTFGYNSLNQLKSVSGDVTATYDYNALGQLVSRTMNGVTSGFGYDRLNRLTSMQTGTNTQTFAYYGGTWMRKSATSASKATQYWYDGHSCVAESVVAGASTTNKRYAIAGGKTAWETVNNEPKLIYTYDGLGSVTGMVQAGIVQSSFSYDAFGNLKSKDATGNPTANTDGPRYKGEHYDAESDLVYLRNRFYDPKIGRFLSLDPMGMIDGPNMYNYCGGDPVNKIDPMGTEEEGIGPFFQLMRWLALGGGGTPAPTPAPTPTPITPTVPTNMVGMGPGMGFGLGAKGLKNVDGVEVLRISMGRSEAFLKIQKAQWAVLANVGSAWASVGALFSTVDAGLHGKDPFEAYFQGSMSGIALAPAGGISAFRFTTATTFGGMGVMGAIEDFDNGNYAGGAFRAFGSGMAFYGGLKEIPNLKLDTKMFLSENPRLNPYNYKLNIEAGTEGVPAMNLLGLNPKISYLAPPVARPGMSPRSYSDGAGGFTKVFGQAEKSSSKTPGHAESINNIVSEMIYSGQYKLIFMQRSFRTATGRTPGSTRNIPDVIGVRHDGRVDAFEVRSNTDFIPILQKRLDEAMFSLPTQNQGNTGVFEPVTPGR